MSVDVTEDVFEDGEIGPTMLVLSQSNIGMFDTFGAVIAKLQSLYPLPDFATHRDAYGVMEEEDGRVDVQMLVDVDNNEASDADIKAWRKGKKRLWNAYARIGIEMVTTRTPSGAEIADAFGIQKI